MELTKSNISTTLLIIIVVAQMSSNTKLCIFWSLELEKMLILLLRRLSLTIIPDSDLKLSAQSVCAMNRFSLVNYQESVLMSSTWTYSLFCGSLYVMPKNSGFSVV